MELLLQKTDSYKPLYLVTACEELRVFGIFEQVTDRIKRMSESVPELLEEVLERLEGKIPSNRLTIEGDYDKELLRNTLSLLECSRGGLLETEMLHLLGREGAPLPSYIWSRLYRSLSAFLRPPGESGEGMLDFFHRQLAKAVRRRYMPDNEDGKRTELSMHKKLATFFLSLSDPKGNLSFTSNDRRGISELPYHLLKGLSSL